jgi:hypothetical protein
MAVRFSFPRTGRALLPRNMNLRIKEVMLVMSNRQYGVKWYSYLRSANIPLSLVSQ